MDILAYGRRGIAPSHTTIQHHSNVNCKHHVKGESGSFGIGRVCPTDAFDECAAFKLDAYTLIYKEVIPWLIASKHICIFDLISRPKLLKKSPSGFGCQAI